MTTIKVADIVAGIPYGNQGKKRWRTVGALLQHDDNDPAKGPGFTVALDGIFNPAGLPMREGQVMLSCFYPKDNREPPKDDYRAPRSPAQPPLSDLEDNIPF